MQPRLGPCADDDAAPPLSAGPAAPLLLAAAATVAGGGGPIPLNGAFVTGKEPTDHPRIRIPAGGAFGANDATRFSACRAG